MVNTANFYKHTDVECDSSQDIVKRIKPLLDEVVERFPDEEQFKIKCIIIIRPTQIAMELWKHWSQKWKIDGPDFSLGLVGNCIYQPGGSTYNLDKRSWADDRYVITIMLDKLENKLFSDRLQSLQVWHNIVKGVIVHEIAHMSYPYRKRQENWDSLKKMKPKARNVMMNKWTNQSNSVPGSEEERELEDNVDNEAIRLGFQKEIDAKNA